MTDELDEAAASDLARRWLANLRSTREEADSSKWSDPEAFDDVLDLMMGDDVVSAWQVAMAMWQQANSDGEQRAIAVGPLETLLRHHGSELLPRVEALAIADPTFSRVLRGIYTHSPIAELVARLDGN